MNPNAQTGTSKGLRFSILRNITREPSDSEVQPVNCIPSRTSPDCARFKVFRPCRDHKSRPELNLRFRPRGEGKEPVTATSETRSKPLGSGELAAVIMALSVGALAATVECF